MTITHHEVQLYAPYRAIILPDTREALVFDTRPLRAAQLPATPKGPTQGRHEGYIGRVWIDHTDAWSVDWADNRERCTGHMPTNAVLPHLGYHVETDRTRRRCLDLSA